MTPAGDDISDDRNGCDSAGAQAATGSPAVLVLGGTAEAAALARALDQRGGSALRIVTSLAGRTASPDALPGETRTGGFGGAGGLADYLRDQGFAALVDATHPFAATVSAHAAAASARSGTPRLRLSRPAWQPVPGDDWHEVASVRAAAEILPRFGRRAFLTVGRRDIDAFAACPDMWFLLRLVDMPREPLPLAECRIIAGKGPFRVDDEARLLDCHEIDVLVCKASGGEMTYPKLAAARARGIPVVMVSRPPDPPGERVQDVDSAMEWLLDLPELKAALAAAER